MIGLIQCIIPVAACTTFCPNFAGINNNNMSESFESKKVIIAGGSSGIGLATAAKLAGEKAHVTVTGRSAARLADATKIIPGIHTAALDSGNRKDLNAFFDTRGNFDHLVIAVSGSKGAGKFADLPLDELRDGFEGKFWPQLNTLQAALPYVNKGGSITLITAISAISRAPGVSRAGCHQRRTGADDPFPCKGNTTLTHQRCFSRRGKYALVGLPPCGRQKRYLRKVRRATPCGKGRRTG